MEQRDHYLLYQRSVDLEFFDQVWVLQQFGTQLYLLDGLHELGDVYFESVLVLLVAVDVALATLHLGQYFVGVDLEAPEVLDLVQVMPADFVLHHELYDLLRVFNHLLQRHVDLDGAQDL